VKIVASAPGKVVILGEYAVLEGAPALAMAVDRRVRVELTTNDGAYWSVAAPGWTHRPARFHFDACGHPRFAADGEPFRMPVHVMEKMFSGRGHRPMIPFHLTLDSTALMQAGPGGGAKLGLGSSAALTVALCHALGYYVASQHGGAHTPDLSTLIDIHCGLQTRLGSGVDVAASLLGGLIEYNRLPAPQAQPAELPQDVEYCFVWSGVPAVTTRFLAAVARWRRDHPERFRRLIAPLMEIAASGTLAARAGDGDEFLRVVSEYAAALQMLGEASGADILSEPHRRLRELAGRRDVVYKPCGAGGGDIGIGMSRDPDALAEFRADLCAENFQSLSLSMDRKGVRTRSEN
jgi:phosphomevalonate kinase